MTESPQQPGADHPRPPASGTGDATRAGADPWAAATDPPPHTTPTGPGTTGPGSTGPGSTGPGTTGAGSATTGTGTGTGAAGGSPRELWSEVGRRFQDLGRAVRTHLEPESPDAASWSPPGEDPAAGRDDWRDDRWADARDAARRIGRSAQQLAAQAGEAIRDPAVRDSAQQAVRSLGDALGRTAEDFGDQLRQNVRSPRWSDPTRPRPDPEPPVTPVRDDTPEDGPGAR